LKTGQKNVTAAKNSVKGMVNAVNALSTIQRILNICPIANAKNPAYLKYLVKNK
jgi:hypothetical protein